jgi:hypothetical protein
VVRIPHVAVKSVTCLGVPHDLGGHRRVCDRGTQGLHLIDRYALVQVAKEAEPRRLQFAGQVDQRQEAERPWATPPP